jgi:hypothetical protein
LFIIEQPLKAQVLSQNEIDSLIIKGIVDKVGRSLLVNLMIIMREVRSKGHEPTRNKQLILSDMVLVLSGSQKM